MNSRVGFDDARLSLEGNSLQVDQEFCVNLRSRTELCNACVEQCPSEAISVTIDAVSVDRDKCQNCGACNASCPTAALSLSGFDPRRFADSVAGQEEVHLHCRESRDGGGGVVIPCHHLLDAELLAGAGRGSVRRWALHGLDLCESCPRGDARAHCGGLHAELEEWLGEAAPVVDLAPAEAAEGERMREDQARLSRRGFLRLAGARGAEQAIRWVVPQNDPAEAFDRLPFFQSSSFPQTPRPYRALLAEARPELAWQADGRSPWRPRQVSESCTLCGSCATRCPTGALMQREQGGVVALGFQSDLCTDCGLCERVCPVDAIVVAEAPVPAAEVSAERRLLLRRSQKLCANCGQPFLPDGEDSFCRTCANERDLDDDWLAMLEG